MTSMEGWLDSLPPPLPGAICDRPMVGGRLRYFWKVWLKAGASQSVVKILRDGLNLNFHTRPTLVRRPSINSSYPDREKNMLIQEAVDSMLLKGAIVPVRDLNSPGFYSRLFLVPKKTGNWRPVIDLSMLNRYIQIPTFKMETAEFIRGHLRQGQWVTSIDLSDAYFHIPMATWTQKYLRFQVLGQVYQFVALPFGLATAPRDFYKVVKELKRISFRLEIMLFQYLDDWLNQTESQESCLLKTQLLLRLTQTLGWLVNLEKSELVPTQTFQFLGYMFDLLRGVCYPPEKKFLSLQEQLSPLFTSQATSPRLLMVVLGHMACMEKLVPYGRLHMRPIQAELKRLWPFRSISTLDQRIVVSSELIPHLRWWSLRHMLWRQYHYTLQFHPYPSLRMPLRRDGVLTWVRSLSKGHGHSRTANYTPI